MIEDPELRGLFRSECEEHLQSLEEGLLRLEANASDSAIGTHRMPRTPTGCCIGSAPRLTIAGRQPS